MKVSRSPEKYSITHGNKYFYRESDFIPLYGGLFMFFDSRITINRKNLNLQIVISNSLGVSYRYYSCELFDKGNRESAFNKLTTLKSKYEDERDKKNKENKI